MERTLVTPGTDSFATNQCWDSGKVEDGHVEDFFEEHRGRLKTYIVRIKEASIVSEEKHV